MTSCPKHETLLVELGSFLQGGDYGASRADTITLLTAALQFLEDCAHPLDCPRNRDDYDCTCPIHHLQEEISDWLDDTSLPKMIYPASLEPSPKVKEVVDLMERSHD